MKHISELFFQLVALFEGTHEVIILDEQGEVLRGDASRNEEAARWEVHEGGAGGSFVVLGALSGLDESPRPACQQRHDQSRLDAECRSALHRIQKSKPPGCARPGITKPSATRQSCGHPVGATGVRMIAEIADHVLGRAGERQVDGATLGAAHTLGGPGVVSTVCVVGAR